MADTGEDLPPGDLSQEFERFYCVDPSRSPATGGVGLGLTIAKQLILTLGGIAGVESVPGEREAGSFMS